MLGRTLALIIGLLVTATTLTAAEKPRVAVWVADIAPAPNGFVSIGDGLTDSVKDMRKHLARDRKHIRQAGDAADAKITITLLSRWMEDAGEIHALKVRVVAKDHSEEITVRDDSTYRNCALAVVKKVEGFVAANYDRLK